MKKLQTDEELMAEKIKASGLKIGDLIGGFQPEPIGKIQSFVMRGKGLYCVVGKDKFPVAEIYYCPDNGEYDRLIEIFRSRKMERGEPYQPIANEDPESRKKRLQGYRRWRDQKKEMGRAKSGRTV